MTQFFRVSAAIAILGALSISVLAQGPKGMVGKPFPKFSLKTISGKNVSNSSIRGKVMLIDFWATWCGPCKAASPTLQKIHSAYKSKGVVVVGANAFEDGDSMQAAGKYASKQKYSYTFAANGDELAGKLGVTSIPAFFLVDKKGVIQKVWVGFSQKVAGEMEAEVKKLAGIK